MICGGRGEGFDGRGNSLSSIGLRKLGSRRSFICLSSVRMGSLFLF